MSEEREEVYQILELGKHEKNLRHKKGFGGLLFIDLSMIKFSKLSSYIRQLDKENQELKLELSGYRQAILNNKEMLGLKEQNEELKKQLENKYEKVGTLTSELLYEENTKLINQQKEFINYLEEELKTLEKDIIETVDNMDIYMKQVKSLIIEEILQKYKSVIGVSDENSKN